MGGAVGINMMAVNLVMDCHEVDQSEKLDLYKDVKLIFSKVLTEQRIIQKAKDAAKKK